MTKQSGGESSRRHRKRPFSLGALKGRGLRSLLSGSGEAAFFLPRGRGCWVASLRRFTCGHVHFQTVALVFYLCSRAVLVFTPLLPNISGFGQCAGLRWLTRQADRNPTEAEERKLLRRSRGRRFASLEPRGTKPPTLSRFVG